MQNPNTLVAVGCTLTADRIGTQMSYRSDVNVRKTSVPSVLVRATG